MCRQERKVVLVVVVVVVVVVNVGFPKQRAPVCVEQ